MYKYLAVHRRKVLYTPLVLYWLLLLLLTSLPAESLPSVKLSDKIEHFLAFFGLGFLLNLAFYFEERYPIINKYSALFTFIAGVLYAAFDELHQSFIPGRNCDIIDVVADVIGLFIGICIINLFIWLFLDKEKKEFTE